MARTAAKNKVTGQLQIKQGLLKIWWLNSNNVTTIFIQRHNNFLNQQYPITLTFECQKLNFRIKSCSSVF